MVGVTSCYGDVLLNNLKSWSGLFKELREKNNRVARLSWQKKCLSWDIISSLWLFIVGDATTVNSVFPWMATHPTRWPLIWLLSAVFSPLLSHDFQHLILIASALINCCSLNSPIMQCDRIYCQRSVSQCDTFKACKIIEIIHYWAQTLKFSK